MAIVGVCSVGVATMGSVGLRLSVLEHWVRLKIKCVGAVGAGSVGVGVGAGSEGGCSHVFR